MPTQNEIRVLLVDDHMVVRKGLAYVLDSATDICVIGEAENGEEALYLTQKLNPDVVLMDVQMEGMGGIKTTQLLVQQHPDIRIIGLSTFAAKEVIMSMMGAGAKGYLLKDVAATELTAAIRQVHDGEGLAVDALLAADNDGLANLPPPSDAEHIPELGSQQKKVLALMTKGFTNPEIATQLGFSLPTARYHVSAILQKLDVSNRSEAVALAIRLNMVREEDF